MEHDSTRTKALSPLEVVHKSLPGLLPVAILGSREIDEVDGMEVVGKGSGIPVRLGERFG